MWQAEDGTYCCVVGNRPADGSGQILLYTSPDGFQWKFKSVLAANNNRFGKMWECPDFFRLDVQMGPSDKPAGYAAGRV